MNKPLLIFIVILLWLNSPTKDFGLEALPSMGDIVRADSLYGATDYISALYYYKQVMAKSDFNNTPELHFKIAYTLYKTEDYNKSAGIFKMLFEKELLIPDFSHFFYIKCLWKTDKEMAANESEKYIQKYKNISLDDSLLIPLADYLFNNNKYLDARDYYLKAKRRNFDKSKRAYLRIQAAISICKSGNRKKAFEEYYQIIKKFSSYSETFDLVLLIKDKYPDFFREHFFNIVDVYLANRKYNELQRLLEDYIQKEKDKLKIEKARYYIIRIYYARGKYRTALYGFNNLLPNLQNKKLEPHIRLYLARIFIRINKKQESIDAYLDYAHRYPTRRIAPQAVWKSAWIYEELNDIVAANRLYEELIRRWPRKSISREAQFRIGLNYFRMQNYIKADSVFNMIKGKRWADLHVTRAKYWQSLCKDKLGNREEAVSIRTELAEDPWMNYYTMKSFLKNKNIEDIKKRLGSNLSGSLQIESNSNLLIDLVNNFEKFFKVRDLLGLDYANCVLDNTKLHSKTLAEWINLGEMYKKVGAYNKAYMIYDYINNKYYNKVKYSDKYLILKERFPFYFDNIIEKYSLRHNVSKELVLALIKRESVFDEHAHSYANAFGLMQIIPPTAKELSSELKENYTDPMQLLEADFNIKLGTYYLKQLLKQFDNRFELVLSAYNAGPHRAKKWLKLKDSDNPEIYIENIEFNETRNYVRIVLKNYWAYQLLNLSFGS